MAAAWANIGALAVFALLWALCYLSTVEGAQHGR